MKLKKNVLCILALLLAFCLVFAGCESDERDYDRDDDDRAENRDDERDEEWDDEDADLGELPVDEAPVYETREVWLCVRATSEQWDGTGSVTSVYTYDEYGNRIREENVNYGSAMVYTYDEDGNQITSQYIAADGTAGSVTEMMYDESGRLLSKISTDSSGELSTEYYYTYDEAGFVVEELRNMHFSGSNYRYVITYNDDHTQGTVQSYKNDELSGYTEETYDQEGKLLTSRSYRADGSFSSGVDCAYDEAGRLTVEKTYSGSELQSDYDIIYTYNENGLLTFKNVDYYYGSGTTYEYESFQIKVRIN